jgi:hypothetical protein
MMEDRNMDYSRPTSARTVMTLGLTFLVVLTSVSGIIRHDVPVQEYLKLGKQKQFDCVGEAGYGSCVLISEKYVLSAAHCFVDFDTKPDTVDTLLDGKKMRFVEYIPYNNRATDFSKVYATFNGRKFKVKRGIIYPGYLDSLARGTDCCDLALLELKQAVTFIKPARIGCTFDELHSDVTGVGYGASCRADQPESLKLEYNGHRLKIAGESVVDSVGGPEFENHESLLFCWFVAPNDKTGRHVARPLEYTCSGGDSGGGLFRQEGNGWELIGICAGGGASLQQLLKTGYYGSRMRWTRLSPFISWITAEMK